MIVENIYIATINKEGYSLYSTIFFPLSINILILYLLNRIILVSLSKTRPLGRSGYPRGFSAGFRPWVRSGLKFYNPP